jgi:4-amino-4-deoxy-L-arabinose transferase-like glycosyltransferase
MWISLVSSRRVALGVVLFAFALRVAAIFVLGDPLDIHRVTRGGGLDWSWGYEQAAVAQAIAEGRGFSDPFAQGTGSTAWVAPFYPALLAGLIKLFGGITPGVAWILALAQSAGAALTCFYLWKLGRHLYSDAAGMAAAVLWAVHPMAIYLPVAMVWDSTFVALSMAWFLSTMVERGREVTPRGAAVLGLGLGATLLVNPAPLALVPVFAWYYLRPKPGHLRFERSGIRKIVILLGTAVLAISPWLIRNAVVVGSVQVRSNLGVELFVGNNDGAFGPFNVRVHPSYDGAELERYRELGEVEYSRYAMGESVEWIKEHPARFGWLTLERFQRFWIGPDPTKPVLLGTGYIQERDWMGWIKWVSHAFFGLCAILGILTWKGRSGSRTLLRGAFLFYPLVYYITHVFERYRFPIEPLITLVAAVFLLRLLFGAKHDWASPNRGELSDR